MKKNSKIIIITRLSLLLVFALLSNMMLAQMSVMSNSLNGFTIQDEEAEDGKKKKKEKKRKDEFKIYVGANFNQLNIADDKYYSNMGVGWDIGFSYKRGKFFYWQVGAQYNNPVYVVKDLDVPPDSSNIFDGVFGVRSIDVPITGGINFLSVTSRIVGLRVYVSAVPSFAIGVGNTDHGLTKDELNPFTLYGQAGVGLDVAFLFLEAGFNYGFTDLFKNDFQSNPYQVFVNLGFRF